MSVLYLAESERMSVPGRVRKDESLLEQAVLAVAAAQAPFTGAGGGNLH
jgi:hypothetical protein